jgi:isopenicillin N synthase-like dioxygenase
VPDARPSPTLGEHTDFGSLAILFNRIGGRQVQLPGTSDWVYVRPVPGCAIINLGDAMVKFSAGLLQSNLHRVVSPPGTQADLVQYSLVYFCRPEHDVKLRRLRGREIDRVAGFEEGEGESSREWLSRRHLGRKMQFFKGEESWEGAKGTEGSRL